MFAICVTNNVTQICKFLIISLNPSRIKKREYFRFVQSVKKVEILFFYWIFSFLECDMFIFERPYSSYPMILPSEKFSTVLTLTILIEIFIVCWDYAVRRTMKCKMSNDSEYQFCATHDDSDVILETFHILESLYASIARLWASI